MDGTANESARHRVVVNDEEQYSVWPESTPLPAGWRATAWFGSREDCLEQIGRVWSDIRPLSARARRARAAR